MSASELRRAANAERAEWSGEENSIYGKAAAVHLALAEWLEEVATDFDRNTLEDSIDCPNCGTACAGHPTGLWHDNCGGAIEDDYYNQDPCLCYAKPLAVARAINGGPR